MAEREAKAELRRAILQWRATLDEKTRFAASSGLLATYRRERPFAAPAIVSAFWPVKDELDIRPLLIELHNDGCQLCLPVVVGKGEPLVFRAWRPGDALEQGVFGTLHPPATRETLEPEALIVPMLACDPSGWRLGYGGGFYDRTLEGLRERGHPVAVGVGFDAQYVISVPHGPKDQKLDWLLTDKRACAFV